jgi:hypothetical protein
MGNDLSPQSFMSETRILLLLDFEAEEVTPLIVVVQQIGNRGLVLFVFSLLGVESQVDSVSVLIKQQCLPDVTWEPK